MQTSRLALWFAEDIEDALTETCGNGQVCSGCNHFRFQIPLDVLALGEAAGNVGKRGEQFLQICCVDAVLQIECDEAEMCLAGLFNA